MSDKRPHGFGRVPVKKSGLKPSRWKAECVERRPLRLEGGKDCKVLPILTVSEAGQLGEPHVEREARSYCLTVDWGVTRIVDPGGDVMATDPRFADHPTTSALVIGGSLAGTCAAPVRGRSER